LERKIHHPKVLGRDIKSRVAVPHADEDWDLWRSGVRLWIVYFRSPKSLANGLAN